MKSIVMDVNKNFKLSLCYRIKISWKKKKFQLRVFNLRYHFVILWSNYAQKAGWKWFKSEKDLKKKKRENSSQVSLESDARTQIITNLCW